ncbi:MAG TPA: toll/interleukin-1 receptor domain-containing protein [Thiotrichales bacterium]|nr:toll/interleukin-1 receptor domain-containing protein [Thiotrichales bacterium]
MSKIFISYKSEDASVADKIKLMLDSFGFETFQDKVNIEPSDQWQQAILCELMSCDMFLCVLSKNFLNSAFCLQETLAVSKDNGQIWDASKCVTDYLPKLHQYALEHIPSYRGSDTYRFFDEKLKRAD